jgi:hypothetical protein
MSKALIIFLSFIRRLAATLFPRSALAQQHRFDRTMKSLPQNFMLLLREALTASWDKRTAYLEVERMGNPALGQCYPTSRTVQHYYPETEIIKGKV